VAVLVPDPIADAGDPEEHRVIDVPLDGGEPRQLSAVPTSGRNYGLGDFQSAGDLLPELEVRAAGNPDRGPVAAVAATRGRARRRGGSRGAQSAGSSTQPGPLTSPGPARSAASTIVYA
jgi:hypothetical protein